MILAIWMIGIVPAFFILAWLDSSCCKDGLDDGFGSSFGMAVVFWPITLMVALFAVILMLSCDFQDVKDIERRRSKDS